MRAPVRSFRPAKATERLRAWALNSYNPRQGVPCQTPVHANHPGPETAHLGTRLGTGEKDTSLVAGLHSINSSLVLKPRGSCCAWEFRHDWHAHCCTSTAMSSLSKRSLVVTSLAWLALWGCNNSLPQESNRTEPEHPITEHRTVKAERPTGQLGDDCTSNGASGCLSGICLHTQPDHKSGYFCSQRCNSAAECLPGWTCAFIHPGIQTTLCIPPATRKSSDPRP